MRPGGPPSSDATTARRYSDDALGAVDLGIRHQPPGGRLSYSASIFHTRWDHIQSDYLLPNGLGSTRNAGRARIIGTEASIAWAITQTTSVEAGLSAQDGRLTHTEDGIIDDDRRLPVTPDLTTRLSI